jgi:ABC-type dipeptide/oligopeptide/nickel transport system ATPase subunit
LLDRNGESPNHVKMSLTAAINAELLTWAKGTLDPWQHEALRRILNNGSLTEQDYMEILQRAQFDLEIAVPPGLLPNVALTPADLPAAPPLSARVYLKALKDLNGVNALKGGQQIDFGQHLTVLYGENASGKSGYARVLKKVARCPARAVEPILPDVFSPSSAPIPCKATFELEEAGAVTLIAWQDGQAVPESMQRFAVFDSKCARSFLTSENEISFVPSVLEGLRQLSNVTDAIKRRLLSLASQAAPPSPPAYQLMVENETTVGQTLGTLSAFTDPTTISSLGQWGDSHVVSLTKKESELQQLRSASPQVIRNQLSREKRDLSTLHKSLGIVAGALSDEKVAELKGQVTELAVQKQAFQAAVQLAFADSQIQGVGSDAWKSLIEAAAKFSTTEAYKEQPFPASTPGSLCVLCHQRLDGDAATRLKRFWDFLQDDAATKRDSAQLRVADSLSAMQVVPESLPEGLVALATEFVEKQLALWTSVLCFFGTARNRLAAVQAASQIGSWESVPALEASAIASCESLLTGVQRALGEIKDDAQVESRVKALGAEIADLKARKRLSENLKIVLDHLAALKRSQELRTTANSLVTNSITIKARQLHTTYVTDSFKQDVAQRIQRLGLQRTKITLDEKPGKGKVLQTIALDGAKQAATPEDVLSEGERTAISLSYFLADLGSAETTAGIIFDDPVSSLDHRIRDGVVKALVSEAKSRQVIVFTHDLAFFCELMSRARFEQLDAIPYYIESFSAAVGLVQGETPWDAMTVKDRLGKLQAHVAEAKAAETSGDAEGYREKMGRFYGRLRATWERAVEELLFNQVVCRYERAVQTMRLRGVSVDKNAITTVFDAMKRCSDIIDAHDHAAAASVPMPSPADMETDLGTLRDFVKAQREKIKVAEQANDHLKG